MARCWITSRLRIGAATYVVNHFFIHGFNALEETIYGTRLKPDAARKQMNLNGISILILVFAILGAGLLPQTHAKALTHKSTIHSVGSQPKPADLGRLIRELRASGVEVDLSKERISQPFFSARGRIINVNTQAVWVFAYANETTAEKDAAKIGRDGMTVGHAKPSWLGTPHFYRQRRLIVLYLGDDSRVLDHLTRVLGQQFAGG